MRIVLGLIFCFLTLNLLPQSVERITVSGKVTDSLTNDGIPQVHVFALGCKLGTVTNNNGEFKLSLPKSESTDSICISHVVYDELFVTTPLHENQEIAFSLSPRAYLLNAIQINNLPSGKMVMEAFNTMTGLQSSGFVSKGYYRERRTLSPNKPQREEESTVKEAIFDIYWARKAKDKNIGKILAWRTVGKIDGDYRQPYGVIPLTH